MKVCFISLKAYPLFNNDIKAMHGGAEVQMSILARHLAQEDGFDVHVITASYRNKPIKKFKNLTIWPTFSFGLFTPLKIIKFLSVFNKIDADVYIQRTLSFYSFFLAAYCRMKGKKFIYMVAHDNELNGREMLFRYPFGKRLVSKLFSKASAIVVQNEFQHNLFKENFNNRYLFVMKKIAQVHENGSYFDHYASYDAIWLARAETWKQPDKFIELAEMNPDKRFLMICPYLSQSYTQSKYNKLAHKAEKTINLTFMTHVIYEQVSGILRKCRVFCSTSTSEGDLPMSILEAATLGLPVLMLSINNYKNNPDEAIGIDCNNNLDMMSEKLNALCEDETLYKHYSETARHYVAQYHCKDTIMQQLKQILQTI